jgi:hypothetical protein
MAEPCVQQTGISKVELVDTQTDTCRVQPEVGQGFGKRTTNFVQSRCEGGQV